MLVLIREIAAIADGLAIDLERATAQTIRDDGRYSGVRLTIRGELSRATIRG